MGNGESPANEEEESFPASLAILAPGHVLDGLRDTGPGLSSESYPQKQSHVRSLQQVHDLQDMGFTQAQPSSLLPKGVKGSPSSLVLGPSFLPLMVQCLCTS